MLRTHTCGELRGNNANEKVTLSGWAVNPKNHGGLLFTYLRDRYGKTQLVFNNKNKEMFEIASKLKREDVITIKGKVNQRPQDMINKDFATGEVEIEVEEINVIAKAKELPIEFDGSINTSDEMRLKYRYIDLRNKDNTDKLILRHNVISAARDFFNKHNFLEIETPLLVKSTPEGARDYLVPSRVNQGKFYALPQSPQLYKQILMVAGVDRYYQLARCLRDEDLRADRQPEHTQFDLEMSFVSSDDVREFVENMFKHIFKTVKNIKLDNFPVFTYKKAMEKYGSDKPDLRFGLELNEITSVVKKTDFKVFNQAEQVACIVAEKDFSRKEIDTLTEFVKKYGAKGLAYVKVKDSIFDAGISKFLDESIQKEIIEKSQAKNGSTIFFVADKEIKTLKILGELRKKLAEHLGLLEGQENEFKFCWVKDFPLFAWNEDENRWEPEHHMFSMPKEEFIDDFENRPKEVIGDLWDLALNGLELGSGSIRISNPEIQERILNFVGFSKEEANKKFGFLLEAYKYGAPVHGGMGLGVDRIVALMAGTNDIREVIAFPKNKNAQCPMDGSPNVVDDVQLKELNIKVIK